MMLRRVAAMSTTLCLCPQRHLFAPTPTAVFPLLVIRPMTFYHDDAHPAKPITSDISTKQSSDSKITTTSSSASSSSSIIEKAIPPTHHESIDAASTDGPRIASEEAAFSAFGNDSFGSNVADGHQLTKHRSKNEWREGWDHHTSANVNPLHRDKGSSSSVVGHTRYDGTFTSAYHSTSFTFHEGGFGVNDVGPSSRTHPTRVTNVKNDSGKHSFTTNKHDDEHADRWRNSWAHEGKAQMKSRSSDDAAAEGDLPKRHRQRSDSQSSRMKLNSKKATS